MSSIDISALQRSLGLFGTDEHGCYISCSLFDLEINFQIDQSSNHREIAQAIRNIHNDLWQVSALTSRLVWMRQMLKEGQLNEHAWMSFSRLDIENFYVQLRSGLDYLAIIVAESGTKRGQLPRSFTSLRNHAQKHSDKLGPELLDLVTSADWYDDLRTIRDSLVHEGANSLVFPDNEEWLLFQVYGKRMSNLVSRSFLLHNQNVAYFQRSAAWAFAHTLSAMDRVGVAVAHRCELQTSVSNSKSYSNGYAFLRDWMSDLLSLLRGST